MRTWSGFEARDALYDHVIRYLPRDFELFARMNAVISTPKRIDMPVRCSRNDSQKNAGRGSTFLKAQRHTSD